MNTFDLSFAQDPNTLALALIAGIVPALLWLFFWTRENSEFPKQTGILFKAFLFGAIAVMAVLPVQEYVTTLSNNPSILNILWAASEEVLKYLAFALAILTARTVNRPVDYAVYIMVCALGFAGLENALYFLGALQSGQTGIFLLAASQRFLGTTLLHAITSSCVGIGIGFAFFGSKIRKCAYGLVGLGIGIFIHSAFNAYVVEGTEARLTIEIFALWTLVLVVLLILERLRYMGGLEYVRAHADSGIEACERSFENILKNSDSTAADERPLRDVLKEKNISAGMLDRMRASMMREYARHLETRGATPAGAKSAAEALMSETVSAKTISTALSTLKDHTLPTVLATTQG